MGCRRTGNTFLALEQTQVADDSFAVSLINNLLIEAATAFSAATVICLLVFTKSLSCLLLQGTETKATKIGQQDKY